MNSSSTKDSDTAITSAIGLADVIAGIKHFPLVMMLGWQDIRQRYRRSVLGPFWLTLSMGIMIGTIGVVFSQILAAPIDEFIPFLSAGLILWGTISTVVTEACTAFIFSEGIIKQLPLPLSVHIFRMIWRNVIILGHNIVILPLVFLVVGKPISSVALLTVPGFTLALINLTWLSFLLGIICTRYRDFPQIVGSLLQVIFYLTPIIWMPDLLPKRAGLYLLDSNPAYHLLEIVRAPLLGHFPTSLNWGVAICCAVIGWIVTIMFYNRYKHRIAYWL